MELGHEMCFPPAFAYFCVGDCKEKILGKLEEKAESRKNRRKIKKKEKKLKNQVSHREQMKSCDYLQ